MNPTISVDLSNWTRNAKALHETSSRSCADFINGQALFVAWKAIKLTIEANRAKIESALGQVGWTEKTISRGKRAGQKVRGKRVINSNVRATLAWRIIAKHFSETGEWLGKGKTDEDRVRDLIARRSRSVSFIRSGWIQAMRKLWTVVKKKPAKASNSEAGARQFGVAKGQAIPAVFRLTGLIQCTIENDIPGHVAGTYPISEKGLQLALRESAKDMADELARRLKVDLKEFGAH